LTQILKPGEIYMTDLQTLSQTTVAERSAAFRPLPLTAKQTGVIELLKTRQQ
jgi:hypothetical protein